MNYQQLARAVEMVLEMGNGNLDSDTPVKIFVDDGYVDVLAVYPEEVDGRLVVIVEASREGLKEANA